ncbi:dipeptidase [Parendozoicomonas sp. Alg238-R29]|uniref:dipeptidase n=1 Tax=Parendozoicomonas sp. Alg238-R29 TaxID=2993446 RepID=UPI00248F32B8|nr:dipeptidase [Parendozoicomonas sp. Alg238-R29]
MIKKLFNTGTLLVVCILVLLVLWLVPPQVERGLNQITPHDPYDISEQAQQLHESLLVADLHTDSLLWSRDLKIKSNYGHADLPRLREGNVAIQVFPAVTKSPRGLNYKSNVAEAPDDITLLAVAQTWPPRTWDSLKERALYQAERLAKLEKQVPEQVRIVRTARDLKVALVTRNSDNKMVAALLATEGSHALDGKLANIQNLYDAGYRMMGLHHFFDNKLGGSLHGITNAGLTDFGRAAVTVMEGLDIIIDVAHSSPAVVGDVLESTSRPIIVSHTGMKGLCDTPRNISDRLMEKIAEKGGLIGIGYWADAVCDASPTGIAKMIVYAIDIVGVDHVALGSDFDGAVTTAMDVSEIAAVTQALLDEGLSEADIRKVMGENVRDFLLKWLPLAS